ncbi:Fur family transcriptional regulator [Desertivirga brevis]|uniref:Fur family transcriptional regulator n=1 Tax=Desertivirga brevis TaxID=2810310 RepID=UPI001A9607BB|nr:transcriptional repressor [Pedobacter sp. SYSU D00873]
MTALAEQKLLSKNINPTAMRLLVVDFLLQGKVALSLSDIEKGLYPSDRITIYRTLKTFVEHGLIHSIDDGTGTPKYALCSDQCDETGHHDLHVHFYCTQCKATHCLPKTKVPIVSLPEGYASEEVSLVIKGLCGICNKD